MRRSTGFLLLALAIAAAGCGSPPAGSHVLRASDIQGVDPITLKPLSGPGGEAFTREDIVDLTLLEVTKDHLLVSRLGIFDRFLPEESARKLSRTQRTWPERDLASWPEDRKEVYYRAAAIVIAEIKRLNPGLASGEMTPGREIVLPEEI